MLCVWWWCGGVIHWELVEKDQTITAETYCAQLDRVQAKLRSPGLSVLSRSGVSFLHDNARPHVAQQTQAKINELGWELVTHPPYSPDLAPSDYHLFRSLEHSLRGKRFINVDQVKKHLSQYFASKSKSFYQRGIYLLPEKWQKVINSNGEYFE